MVEHLVDLKLVSRPDRLSNGDQWQQFKFLFENMMGCVSSEFRSELEMAGTREAEIVDNPAWTDDQKRRSATLYTTLASLTSGPPQHIVRSVVSRSGYEAWRKLCREYEARSGSQKLAILVQCLEGTYLKGSSVDTFMDNLRLWEELVHRYESQTLEDIGDAIRCAVILKYAPEQVQAHIQVNAATYDTYAKMRDAVTNYCTTSHLGIQADRNGHWCLW